MREGANWGEGQGAEGTGQCNERRRRVTIGTPYRVLGTFPFVPLSLCHFVTLSLCPFAPLPLSPIVSHELTPSAASPERTKAIAQATNTIFQLALVPTMNPIKVGPTTAPKLPHIFPHPSTDPAYFPPTSCWNAHTAGMPRSVRRFVMARMATAVQGEGFP